MKKIFPVLLSCLLAGCFVCRKTAPAAEEPAEIIVQQVNEETKQPAVKEILVFKADKHAQFEFDSDALTEEGYANLRLVASELRKFPDSALTIVGHTCNMGKENYNQALSEKRAAAIAKALKEDYGINNDITIIGKGSSEPKKSNDTMAGRKANRRVEIIVADK